MRKTFLKDSHEYNVTETMFANVTRKTHNAKKKAPRIQRKINSRKSLALLGYRS